MNRVESPLVIPPESISQNWVSKNNFNLNEDLTYSFKLRSSNSSGKELGFYTFLVNDESTGVFAADTARGGLFDYSTKGEVAEGIADSNGEKFIVKNNSGGNMDLILDHVYTEDKNILVKNQIPFNTPGFINKNTFSVAFFSHKKFLEKTQDIYNNYYFDALDGIKDLYTKEPVNLTDYTDKNIIFVQNGNALYITEFKTPENVTYDILNLDDVIIRFNFENKGEIFKIDILNANTESFLTLVEPVKVDIDIENLNNLKIGYGIGSPLFSYDPNKKADFEIVDFHIQGKLMK